MVAHRLEAWRVEKRRKEELEEEQRLAEEIQKRRRDKVLFLVCVCATYLRKSIHVQSKRGYK